MVYIVTNILVDRCLLLLQANDEVGLGEGFKKSKVVAQSGDLVGQVPRALRLVEPSV